MNQEKIGKFIAKCRKENNLTQEQVAEKLGISNRAVSKWENGKCLMDISFLKPLSEILGVSVVEILNGEKIENENVYRKSEEVALNTLNYANNKIKSNKFKTIIIAVIILVILFISGFVIYKGISLAKYNAKPLDNYREFVNGLEVKNTINIYRRTIKEEDYITEANIKLRNDFHDYTRTEEYDTIKYNLYNGDTFKSAVWFSETTQYIDYFTANSMTIYTTNGNSNSGDFTDADRKYFLLRNDINNDLDFLEYIRNNYYLENNLFTSKREMKENYAVNLFVSVALPSMESMTLITGDYNGYIFNVREDLREVHILRNDKVYIFSFIGNDVTSDEYIQDLLSTLEIKEITD